RDPARERFWRRTFRDQQRSGVPVRDFYQREGPRDWTLRWWRQELARGDQELSVALPAEPTARPPSFLQVPVVDLEAVAPRTAPPNRRRASGRLRRPSAVRVRPQDPR